MKKLYHSRWNHKENLRMLEMVANGKTYDEIAMALGRTRNAVVFKLTRLRKDPEMMKLYAEMMKLYAECRVSAEKRSRVEEQRRGLDCMPNPFRFVHPEW